MSVKVMGLMWDLELPRNEKFILLAYADHANHEGKNVFPSVKLIAKKTGYDHRSVQRITRKLENRGLLLEDGKGPKGTKRWRIPITVGDDKLSPIYVGPSDKTIEEGVTKAAHRGDIAMSSEPSLTIKEPLKDSRSKTKRNTNNRVRKALEEQFIDSTGLKSPSTNTAKQRSTAGELWWSQLIEIAKETDWDIARGQMLIRRTVDQMRKDKLTISSPKSIVNVAKSIIAEGTGRSISGAREFLDELRSSAN